MSETDTTRTLATDRIDDELGRVPATLSEEQSNLVQMQEISERTIEPGLLRLPVGTVTTAENSPKFAIEVKHPIDGSLRVFAEKPRQGWSDDNRLVELLEWYDIHDDDPYKLQTGDVYIRHKGDAADQPHGWEIVKPPHKRPDPTRRERLRAWVKGSTGYLPTRSAASIWGGLLIATLLSPLALGIAPFVGAGVFTALLSNAAMFIGMTVAMMVLYEPHEVRQ